MPLITESMVMRPSLAWKQLMDPGGFLAPFGLTTAERRHPEFRSHGCCQCEWDGAVWPFATSQTLVALQHRRPVAFQLQLHGEPVLGGLRLQGTAAARRRSQAELDERLLLVGAPTVMLEKLPRGDEAIGALERAVDEAARGRSSAIGRRPRHPTQLDRPWDGNVLEPAKLNQGHQAL